METIRNWLTPTEETALLALAPSTAISKWLSTETPTDESSKEAPYLVSGAWGVSLLSHIRSVIWTEGLVEKGYREHRDGMFRMPFYGTWATIVSGKYIDEIARAPDTYLSFQESFNEQLQLEYLVGRELSHHHIHLALLKTLNRNLEAIYDEIADETEYAISKGLEDGKVEDGWTSIKAFNFMAAVIHQLNQRAFVGLSLSRDEEWVKASHQEDQNLAIRGTLLRLFPKSRRGDAHEYLSRFGKSTTLARDIISKTIKERTAMAEEDRPNDLLSWTISRVPGEEPDSKLVCGMLSLLSMVANGTTSMSFSHAFYYLVAHPEYRDILYEEILEATDGGDLTYESFARMHKLDSFIHESQRLCGIANVSLGRIVMKDFTFSNGVVIPAGEMVQAVATPIHQDPEYYPDPLEFKPWRFYDLARAEGMDTYGSGGMDKYNAVSTSNINLTWGLGRHSCPGRWYASMVMKHLMAYFILHYEFKLPESAKGQRPANLYLTGACIPNTSVHLLFRRRETETRV